MNHQETNLLSRFFLFRQRWKNFFQALQCRHDIVRQCLNAKGLEVHLAGLIMLLQRNMPLGVGAFLVRVIDVQLTVCLYQNPVANDGDRMPRPFTIRNGALRNSPKIVEAAGLGGGTASVAQLHLVAFRHAGLERRMQNNATVSNGIQFGISLQDKVAIGPWAKQVTAWVATTQFTAGSHTPTAQALAVEQGKPGSNYVVRTPYRCTERPVTIKGTGFA